MPAFLLIRWVQFAIMAAVVVAVFGAGWTTRGWKADAAIAELNVERANTAAAQASAALADIVGATKTINDAALRYGSQQSTLSKQIADLKKDIKNEIPLPVDCKPDASRVRRLDAGIDAINKAATRQPPGGKVP